jgi:hypothetical protein
MEVFGEASDTNMGIATAVPVEDTQSMKLVLCSNSGLSFTGLASGSGWDDHCLNHAVVPVAVTHTW